MTQINLCEAVKIVICHGNVVFSIMLALRLAREREVTESGISRF